MSTHAKVPPGQYAIEYIEALKLFNKGLYFESHEELEQLWVKLPKGADKTFYQAIIHIAAAFLHRSRERAKPALSQYRRACEKLRSLNQDEYRGVLIPSLLSYLDPYFLPLEDKLEIDSSLPAPRLSLLDFEIN
ncbi:MAG TPA: DUF309 domain-containing protein [Blastocatellia bacterium]|nr:DUF309 domain-containing protein [Blastocatellia bacterium]